MKQLLIAITLILAALGAAGGLQAAGKGAAARPVAMEAPPAPLPATGSAAQAAFRIAASSPASTPAPVLNYMVLALRSKAQRTPTPTPTPTPTLTLTPRPTLTAADIAFILTWEGPYASGNAIQYAPCFHYDPAAFDNVTITQDNYYNYFHAGDMYNLNSTAPARTYTILAPISGIVINISNSGPENGTMIVIQSNVVYDGKPVYVSMAHLSDPFQGDSMFSGIGLGSVVKQGQPLAIHNTMYQWGIPEQAIDMQVRLEANAEGYPLGPGWNPNDFLDPFPYLQDDLVSLLQEEKVVFGYNRDHCLSSGHFPGN